MSPATPSPTMFRPASSDHQGKGLYPSPASNRSADSSTDPEGQLVWTGGVTLGEELVNSTPSSLPDPQYYDPVYQTVAVTLSSIVFTVGLVGNVLVVIVIARSRSMHTTTNCYLLSLAVADCLVLLAGTLPAVPETFFRVDEWPFGRVLCSILIYCQYVGVDASSLSITAFTIERYIAICHPIRAQTMCTVSRAKRITGGLWLFTVLYCGPWLGLTDLSVNRLSDGSQITKCQFRLARSSYLVLYMFDLVVFYILPFLISTALYCLIARILVLTSLQHSRDGPARSTVERSRSAEKSSQRQQRTSKRRGDSRVQVIRMLVVVVVVFATLWMPYRVMVVYNSFAQHKFMDLWFLMFSRTLIYINCAINPILYNVMSVKFRRAFKSLLCCGLRPAGTPVFLYSEMGTDGGSHSKRHTFSNRRLSPNTSTRTTEMSCFLSSASRPSPHHKQGAYPSQDARKDHTLKVILLEWVKGSDRVKVQTSHQSDGHGIMRERVKRQLCRNGKKKRAELPEPKAFRCTAVITSSDKDLSQQSDYQDGVRGLSQMSDHGNDVRNLLKGTDRYDDVKELSKQSDHYSDVMTLLKGADHYDDVKELPKQSDHYNDVRDLPLEFYPHDNVTDGREVWQQCGDVYGITSNPKLDTRSSKNNVEEVLMQESAC